MLSLKQSLSISGGSRCRKRLIQLVAKRWKRHHQVFYFQSNHYRAARQRARAQPTLPTRILTGRTHPMLPVTPTARIVQTRTAQTPETLTPTELMRRMQTERTPASSDVFRSEEHTS